MIDNDGTQSPAWTTPGYNSFTRGQAMAAYLMELAAAVAKVGEIPETSFDISFQVVPRGSAGNRERCAAVDAITGALGLQAAFGQCGGWWDYATSNKGQPHTGISVFTCAVTAEEYEEARQAAGADQTQAEVTAQEPAPVSAECADGEQTDAEARLAVSDTVMATGLTKHWAYRDRINPDWWWVTWLPAAQVCDRSQAITAMSIVMAVTAAQREGHTLDETHPQWRLLGAWAVELGLSAAQAVRLAGAELPTAAPGAFVNPNGQIQDTRTGAWRYVREGYAAARGRQLAELQHAAGVAR